MFFFSIHEHYVGCFHVSGLPMLFVSVACMLHLKTFILFACILNYLHLYELISGCYILMVSLTYIFFVGIAGVFYMAMMTI